MGGDGAQAGGARRQEECNHPLQHRSKPAFQSKCHRHLRGPTGLLGKSWGQALIRGEGDGAEISNGPRGGDRWPPVPSKSTTRLRIPAPERCIRTIPTRRITMFMLVYNLLCLYQ
ncbi:hypothetical protein NDU88_001063 [Pleurodeles waltl]|uniref:Uncharacterized protein n=1 Tax=Pleurodeles waltl TaxID=8319 RepID=A0AAV7UVV3_PLEWA|nr:hypothetical protein NDU88_001063 [Pleurodeles waltl]